VHQQILDFIEVYSYEGSEVLPTKCGLWIILALDHRYGVNDFFEEWTIMVEKIFF